MAWPDELAAASPLKEGESCAAANPSLVTSENSFLSAVGGLLDGMLLVVKAEHRIINSQRRSHKLEKSNNL